MALGIGIYNIPRDIALGSMFLFSPIRGLHLGVLLLLHGIPEGIAIGVLLKEYGAGISISLASVGGFIHYITCRETLYHIREKREGRLSTVGNTLGMGVFFITFSTDYRKQFSWSDKTANLCWSVTKLLFTYSVIHPSI